jgi:hypothetical protein
MNSSEVGVVVNILTNSGQKFQLDSSLARFVELTDHFIRQIRNTINIVQPKNFEAISQIVNSSKCYENKY